MKQVFEYHYDNNFTSGFFQYARNEHFSNSIAITSPDSEITSAFCTNEYHGGEAKFVIDGVISSCWCNSKFDIDYQVFYIDLKTVLFQLHNFAFRSVCAVPSILEIKGSNDEKHYQHICQITDIVNEYEFSIHKCTSMNAYRYFEIRQIGENRSGGKRLHVSEIEFFGVLNPGATCDHKIIFHFSLLYQMTIIHTLLS